MYDVWGWRDLVGVDRESICVQLCSVDVCRRDLVGGGCGGCMHGGVGEGGEESRQIPFRSMLAIYSLFLGDENESENEKNK